MNADLQLDPPPAVQGESHESAVAVNLEIAGLLMIPPACETMTAIVKADLESALEAQNLLAVREPDAAHNLKPRYSLHAACGANGIYLLSVVSDFRKALVTLETELKRTGLLAHAEIGWLCRDEMIWRRFHPKTDASPFSPKIVDPVEKRIVNTKLLHTLAWFLKPRPAFPPP
jgi:hypothetical protein